MEQNTISLTFKNSLGSKFTITLDDPKSDLEEQNIIDAMNVIKEKNIFEPGGYDLTECVTAKVTNATITEYDLAI